MPQAIWNGVVIADSEDTIVIEGNHYFPGDSVRWELLDRSTHHTTCPWKGVASYYDITVDGVTNRSAAWQYETPKQAAAEITGYIAFWHGVRVGKPRPADDQASGEPGRSLLSRLFGSSSR